jgi:hypothetical protein
MTMFKPIPAVLLALVIYVPPGAAGDFSTRAAVGGGVGGALGALVGAELGGRGGAILGGGLGAAAGTAVATDVYPHRRYYPAGGYGYYGGEYEEEHEWKGGKWHRHRHDD